MATFTIQPHGRLQEWIAHCVVHHGMYGFACKICGREGMKYTKIITRKL